MQKITMFLKLINNVFFKPLVNSITTNWNTLRLENKDTTKTTWKEYPSTCVDLSLPPYTICRFKRTLPTDVLATYERTYGKRFLFINEITNMQGHGLFIETMTMKVISGLHIDSFEVLPDADM